VGQRAGEKKKGEKKRFTAKVREFMLKNKKQKKNTLSINRRDRGGEKEERYGENRGTIAIKNGKKKTANTPKRQRARIRMGRSAVAVRKRKIMRANGEQAIEELPRLSWTGLKVKARRKEHTNQRKE